MPSTLEAGLYLVATPIGNLGDITYRAVETLKAVDAIFCEDTRISRRLLAHYGIGTRLSVYNDFSDEADRNSILDRLRAGEAIALISDAGLPLISDPGFKLLNAIRDASLPVTAVPGPTAFATALTLSGLPPHPSLFVGFLPSKSGQRRKALEALVAVNATLIFYESPRRAKSAVADMAAVLGNRRAAILRELTKRHEQIATGSLAELAARLGDAVPLRGEFVIVTGPPSEQRLAGDLSLNEQRLRNLIGELGLKEAVKSFVLETGQSRNAVYGRALGLKDATSNDS